MIYIFEDRYERRSNNQKIVSTFPGKIEFAKFDIDPEQDLSEFIINRFHDAECIMLHKSYVFKNKDVNIEKVVSILSKEYGVHCVIFSGGTEKGKITLDGNVIINADVMYKNLEEFMNHHSHQGVIEFAKLLWGKNYKLNSLLEIQYKITLKMVDDDLSSLLDRDFLIDLIDDLNLDNWNITEKIDRLGGVISGNQLLNIIDSEIYQLKA